MPITREFLHKEWEETGTLGLAPNWFKGADPTSGRGVAHDMLEHFLVSPGIVAGECEALGAFMLLRLENGWLESNRGGMADGVTSLSNDFISVIHDILDNEHPLPSAAEAAPLEDSSEIRLQAALDMAFSNVDKVVDNYLEAEDNRAEAKQNLHACKTDFGNWVRKGYRKAQDRYRKNCTYEVGIYLFGEIEKKVDELLKSGSLWDYAKVRVSASPTTREVNIKVFVPDTNRWIASSKLH